jgi:hypothetical protein
LAIVLGFVTGIAAVASVFGSSMFLPAFGVWMASWLSGFGWVAVAILVDALFVTLAARRIRPTVPFALGSMFGLLASFGFLVAIAATTT